MRATIILCISEVPEKMRAGTAPDWLEPLFPWKQESIVVNGRRMAYIDEGARTGRPVLLLSGNPTWGYLYRDFVEPWTRIEYVPLWSAPTVSTLVLQPAR